MDSTLNDEGPIYSGSYAFDADYRLTTAELKTGLDVYLFADFTTFDHTWFAWPKGSVASDYKTHFPIKLAERTLARLPQLTGAVDMAAVNPANIGAIKVVGVAQETNNPLASLFPSMPNPLIRWQRWSTPKVLAPIGTPEGTYSIVVKNDAVNGEFSLSVSRPGTYVVRLAGFNGWGTWARQYVDIPVIVTDANGNGILDHVEARGGSAGATIVIDSAYCTSPISGSVMTCTLTGANLPQGIVVSASNCSPAPMTALAGGTGSSKQFACTPGNVGASVATTYTVLGYTRPYPAIPTAIVAGAASGSTLVAPTPSAPSGTIATLTPVFTWSGGSGAVNYEINVRDLTTNAIVLRQQGIGTGATSFTMPVGTLVNSRQYRWDISACPNFACSSGFVTSGNLTFTRP